MKDILLRRLIGAGVLLLAAFSLASLLPSPEQGDGVTVLQTQPGDQRVVTYELRGGRPVGLQLDAEFDAPQETKKRALARPGPKLAPAATPIASKGEAGEEPAPVVPKPSAKPTPETKAAPKPQAKPDPKPAAKPEPQFDPGATRWSVQVASFADPGNARKTRERLKAEKLRAHVQEVHVGNAVWFRVRVGPYPAESEARKAMEQVKRLDFRGARLVEE